MNITSVSTATAPSASRYDGQVKQLEAQEKQFEQMILQQSANDDHSETKQIKAQLYQTQITQVQMKEEKFKAEDAKEQIVNQDGKGSEDDGRENDKDESKEHSKKSRIAITNNSTDGHIDILV